MKYILGVDAGATKTTAQIANEEGKVLATVVGAAANLQTSQKDFKKNIKETVNVAIKESGQEIAQFFAACFGVAGVNTSDDWQEARRLISGAVKVQSPNNLLLYNDTKIVRPACSNNEFGITVIAGTGSNFYGINSAGQETYAGGLDYILSDEASGYWIGLNVLRAAVRSADGRGEKSMLEDLVLEYFKIKGARALADIVYEEGYGKRDIAEISKLADEAYMKDDKVATEILENAANEIAAGINAVAKKLDMEKENFDIVAIGGVFNSPFPFDEKVPKYMTCPNAELIICDKDPVEGAVKLALKLIGQE
ncbi:MAG: BadF/BadG/BcrA/BcrD ATPase family protein [Candidatus Spechtbacterales bacterium]|nr:BadF/BadG/BcrA/BcrD ATPase family protein [Candidatus Spechtbacterales bacterium]